MSRRLALAAAAVVASVFLGAANSPPTFWPTIPTVFDVPTRITADAGGLLLVTDYDAGGVLLVDPASLTILKKFSVRGSVTGIATFADHIFVGNESFHRIEVYDRAGSFMGLLSGDGGVTSDPSDLAVDQTRGLLFAVDGGAHAIRVFSLNGLGSLERTISGPGLTPDRLNHPTGIAVSPSTSEVFVADYGDVENGAEPRISVFGYDGTYHGSLSGSAGAQGYLFSKPQGLALNDRGHLFVVDAWLGTVLVFDVASGQLLGRVGEFGDAAGQLRLPLDATINKSTGDLFVTSSLTHRIERFAKGGNR